MATTFTGLVEDRRLLDVDELTEDRLDAVVVRLEVLQHQLALRPVDRAVDVIEGGPGPVPEIDEDLDPVLWFRHQARDVLVGRVAVDVGPDDTSEVVGPGQAGLGVQDRDR